MFCLVHCYNALLVLSEWNIASPRIRNSAGPRVRNSAGPRIRNSALPRIRNSADPRVYRSLAVFFVLIN